MKTYDEDVFIIKDLFLASFIYTNNVPLIDLRQDESGAFLWFCFSNPIKCKELERRFWQKGCIVEVEPYLNAMRTLKQRVFLFNKTPSGGGERQTKTAIKRAVHGN